MKKWNEPKVYQLGFENTQDTYHYCHSSKSMVCGDNKDADPNNDMEHHNASGKPHQWTGLGCKEHEVGENANGQGQFACCCWES